MERTLAILAAILVIRFAAIEALNRGPIKRKTAFRFPISTFGRIAFGLGPPLSLYAAYKAVEIMQETGEWWLPVIWIGLVLLAVIGDPGEVYLRPEGIELHRFYGLRRTRLSWEGTVARYSPATHEVDVVGSDGKSITHSKFHIGQAQFMAELKRHNVPIQ